MASNLFDLSGEVALVTGAASGIGKQVAGAFARAGASVVLLARRRDRLEAAAEEIRQGGGKAAIVAGDLLDRAALPGLAKQAAEPFGAPGILFNGAGVNFREAVEDITWESWDGTINLNLAVPFFLSRELVPAMQARGRGKIINVASLQTERAFTRGLAYGASKGGVGQLTRAMAEAWSASGIGCNAVAPGFFRTELTEKVFDDSAWAQKLADQTAIGRNGNVEDLDGTVVFLAARASDYVTGQVIYVDGGFTAK
jgi:NAD(P)-dependent dehydrogenase (short-subunit alcohol dehydrogenase family)